MDALSSKNVLSAEAKDKAKKVCVELVDRLYEYFVQNKKEAKLDTISGLLSAMVLLLEEPDLGVKESDLEEVDML